MEPRALKIMPIGPEIDQNGYRIDDKCDQNPTLWHRIANGTTFRANEPTFRAHLESMGTSGKHLQLKMEHWMSNRTLKTMLYVGWSLFKLSKLVCSEILQPITIYDPIDHTDGTTKQSRHTLSPGTLNKDVVTIQPYIFKCSVPSYIIILYPTPTTKEQHKPSDPHAGKKKRALVMHHPFQITP